MIRFIHSSTVMWHAHESKRKPHASHPIIARLLDDTFLRRWKKRKQLECIRRKIGDKSFNNIRDVTQLTPGHRTTSNNLPLAAAVVVIIIISQTHSDEWQKLYREILSNLILMRELVDNLISIFMKQLYAHIDSDFSRIFFTRILHQFQSIKKKCCRRRFVEYESSNWTATRWWLLMSSNEIMKQMAIVCKLSISNVTRKENPRATACHLQISIYSTLAHSVNVFSIISVSRLYRWTSMVHGRMERRWRRTKTGEKVLELQQFAFHSKLCVGGVPLKRKSNHMIIKCFFLSNNNNKLFQQLPKFLHIQEAHARVTRPMAWHFWFDCSHLNISHMCRLSFFGASSSPFVWDDAYCM